MNAPRSTLNATEVDAIEARFALRVCAELNSSGSALPHDISERLRVARLRAVESGRQAAVVLAPQTQSQGQLTTTLGQLGGRGDASGPWWKFASVLPLVVLLAGMALVHYFEEVERIDAAAEVDAALLADDLPPEAYTDPGFAEFLSSDSSRD